MFFIILQRVNRKQLSVNQTLKYENKNMKNTFVNIRELGTQPHLKHIKSGFRFEIDEKSNFNIVSQW